jgi:hypothetical protein
MVKRATLVVTVTVLSVLAAFALLTATIAGGAYVAGDSTLPSTFAAVGVVLALATLLLAAMQRSHRRASGPGASAIGADCAGDRDLVRTRDELRAAGVTAGGSPARHPRAPQR